MKRLVLLSLIVLLLCPIVGYSANDWYYEYQRDKERHDYEDRQRRLEQERDDMKRERDREKYEEKQQRDSERFYRDNFPNYPYK
jgi:hypothetical protein